jgi:hypothetical protein
MKRCSRCGQERPLEEFTRNKSRPDGLSVQCKECRHIYYRANQTRIRQVRLTWQRNNRDVIRDHREKKRLLTPEQFSAALEKQGGVCAICRRPPAQDRLLCIDHNHQTGQVRGLLCGSCNRAIGLLGDNLGRVLAAAEYLKQYSAPNN